MHPLIGSSAAAAQEPPTLAGAPTPYFTPELTHRLQRDVLPFPFFFFFFPFPFGLRCALRVLFYKIPSRQ